MWLFNRLSVRIKLALLAGVPVLGVLLLSALIARDAQELRHLRRRNLLNLHLETYLVEG